MLPPELLPTRVPHRSDRDPARKAGSAPKKLRRDVGTDHFFAYRAPELAHLGFDLGGFASHDLVDEAGLIRQLARAERHAVRKVHGGVHALEDALRVLFR